MLFCATTLESANRDKKVSRACMSWAEREYDLEAPLLEALGDWTRRAIAWVIHILKVRVLARLADRTPS